MPGPVQIRVKRKRDEEPVESLYLESANKRRPDPRYVFRRLVDESDTQLPDQDPLIPRILPTLPGHEDDVLHKTQNEEAPSNAACTTPPPAEEGRHNDTNGPIEPRRFCLSQSRNFNRPPERPLKRKLAVFVETRQPRDALNGAVQSNGEATNQGNDATEMKEDEIMELSAGQPPRKKPTLAARLRKEEKLPGYVEKQGPIDQLGDTLQAYAAEQYEDDREHPSFKNPVPETLVPPQQEDPDAHINDEDEMDIFEEEGYIEDIYIRHPNANLSSSIDTCAMSKNGVGYLVINKEDEPFWEACGAEDDWESDQDWDSEQDDENAENYYGADYPEEEVESDDEFGYNTYKYRHKGASDENEYDSDSDVWNNVGDDDRYPWGKPTVQMSIGANDEAELSE